MANGYVKVDGRTIVLSEGMTVLDAVKKAGINLPTFCYQPELTPFGSCRMCMVEIEGRGAMPACSTPAADGMDITTDTPRLRRLRRIIIELLLASHSDNCPTCPKSGSCKLLSVSRSLGVEHTRYKHVAKQAMPDRSSPGVFRDNTKCILCGNCVRVCNEIQSVGALSFMGRGTGASIVAGCRENLGDTSCVGCGQCIKVCPVGALSVHTSVSGVWNAIGEKDKLVVVQVAPAVNVALGESFGLGAGEIVSGKIAAALRRLGFDRVYDTAFAADLTVIEEGNEFLRRLESGDALPQFTSCCPAWVKFAEQSYPDMLGNLSSCRSPQQMFGALCKESIMRETGRRREDIVVVSVMPCTAKKLEIARPELSHEGTPDVDFVITTTELADMIRYRGLSFSALEGEEFDDPFGRKSGAGIIFGASGGVTEAVLRYAAAKLGAEKIEVRETRPEPWLRVLEGSAGGRLLRIAVVSGLGNTRRLIEKIRTGRERFDLVEVMACCGGCVSGGGQPVREDVSDTAERRTEGLMLFDKLLDEHSSEKNEALMSLYSGILADEHTRHELLHTVYHERETR